MAKSLIKSGMAGATIVSMYITIKPIMLKMANVRQFESLKKADRISSKDNQVDWSKVKDYLKLLFSFKDSSIVPWLKNIRIIIWSSSDFIMVFYSKHCHSKVYYYYYTADDTYVDVDCIHYRYDLYWFYDDNLF